MRKSTLYGPRVRGDLDLGLEPTRLDGAGDQLRARIDAPGGRLPGRPDQSIYEESQYKNFRIGSRRVIEDRVFRYSRVAENCLGVRVLFTDGSRVKGNTGFTGSFLGALINAVTITYHPLPAVAENELAEGILGCFNPYLNLGIASNTESAGGGAACIVTLKEPLPIAMAAGAWICCYPNIYAYLLNSGEYPQGCPTPHNNIFFSGACVALVPNQVTANYYFWGQTWGPCEMMIGLWGNLVGRTANQREVFVCFDGGIVYHAGVGATDCLLQTMGHVIMAGTTTSTPNGDQLVFLRLAP